MLRIVLVALLTVLSCSVALAQKRVALVIGIDRYDNLDQRAQLKRARSDAAAIARTLKELGFELIAKEDVTRSAFNSYWQDFLNKLEPGDTAAFYFAGHGVEFGGRSYLLPRDVPNLKPGRDELLRREALSLQEFLADLREKGTRLNVVILDACRDNPFEQLAGRTIGSRRGLVVAEPPEGTFIMYSAGTGESALDRLNEADRDPNSVYTRHLIPLLRRPDLSLTEVAEQVRVAVRQMASVVKHRQTPAYYNQVLGRVCIAGGDCSAPSPAQAIRLSEAAEAWDRTKDSHSVSALEAFIRRFGDTYYSDLAKMRVSELKEAEAAKQAADAAKKRSEKEARAKAAPLFPPPDDDSSTISLSSDAEFWWAITGTSDPKNFEDYLKQFPNGRFRVLALRRLEDLKSAPKRRPPNYEAGVQDAIVVSAVSRITTNHPRVEAERSVRALARARAILARLPVAGVRPDLVESSVEAARLLAYMGRGIPYDESWSPPVATSRYVKIELRAKIRQLPDQSDRRLAAQLDPAADSVVSGQALRLRAMRDSFCTPYSSVWKH